MNDIVKQIEEKGYKLYKGHGSGKHIYTFEIENIESINYGAVCVKTPDGEYKTIVGRLDQPVYIGDKTLKTSRRELIEAMYHPSENDWCILEHGYGLQTKEWFTNAYKQLGMIDYKCFECGGVGVKDVPVENETTKPFETMFINGSADISVVDGNYVLQIFNQADIDAFFCYQFKFKQEPHMEDVHAAFSLKELEGEIGCGRKAIVKYQEFSNEMIWFENPEIINKIIRSHKALQMFFTDGENLEVTLKDIDNDTPDFTQGYGGRK